MKTEKSTSAWTLQQMEAVLRMHEAGGEPGLAQPHQITHKTGLQILEAMMSGQLPYPPMNETLNMTLMEVGEGHAIFQGLPLLQHYNPMGTVHGGWFATLLDSALGCAVQTTLPLGRSYTTSGLNVHLVRPASLGTGPLRAVASVIHAGRQITTAEARVEDEKGKLYAHATTTCFIFDMPKT